MKDQLKSLPEAGLENPTCPNYPFNCYNSQQLIANHQLLLNSPNLNRLIPTATDQRSPIRANSSG
jgi:hypothetical protein